LYTLIVGALTEGVASAVAHALYPVVPGSLDRHEYTPFQQHMRPFELLLLAGVLWWSLNQTFQREKTTGLSRSSGGPEPHSKWVVPMRLAKTLGATTGYLLIVVTMLSVLEPEGLGWTLATAGAGMGVGTAAYLLLRRVGRQHLTTILGGNDTSGN
jgi:hypothetical protein